MFFSTSLRTGGEGSLWDNSTMRDDGHRNYDLDESTLIVEHFMTHDQLKVLFKVFATPVEEFDDLDWIAPAWWYMASATVQI